MATTAKIAKELKAPKYKIRLRNRCQLCGLWHLATKPGR